MNRYTTLENKLNINIVKELKYSINNQKNIEQKLSLLNNKDEVINYILICQKNINEIMLISTCLTNKHNDYLIQDIIIYSIDHIYPFIEYCISNHLDAIYINNNKEPISIIDKIYTELLYYFENDIIFNHVECKDFYLNCFKIYINLLQIGYLLTKKKDYLSICTDFSNL